MGTQNVASCLLQHTGFFREIARVATFMVAAMAAMTAVVYFAHADIVGFIGAYATVYVAGGNVPGCVEIRSAGVSV